MVLTKIMLTELVRKGLLTKAELIAGLDAFPKEGEMRDAVKDAEKVIRNLPD
jgi:hypothetical protein